MIAGKISTANSYTQKTINIIVHFSHNNHIHYTYRGQFRNVDDTPSFA